MTRWVGPPWGSGVNNDAASEIDPDVLDWDSLPPCGGCEKPIIKGCRVLFVPHIPEPKEYPYHAYCFLENVLGEGIAIEAIPEGPNPHITPVTIIDD